MSSTVQKFLYFPTVNTYWLNCQKVQFPDCLTSTVACVPMTGYETCTVSRIPNWQTMRHVQYLVSPWQAMRHVQYLVSPTDKLCDIFNSISCSQLTVYETCTVSCVPNWHTMRHVQYFVSPTDKLCDIFNSILCSQLTVYVTCACTVTRCTDEISISDVNRHKTSLAIIYMCLKMYCYKCTF